MEEEFQLLNFRCDGCGRDIGNPRFHCTECTDYDFCEKCFHQHGDLCERGHLMSKETGSKAAYHAQLRQVQGGVGMKLHLSCKLYADRPCLGYKNPYTNQYQFDNYATIYQQACALGLGLYKTGVFSLPRVVTTTQSQESEGTIQKEGKKETALVDLEAIGLGKKPEAGEEEGYGHLPMIAILLKNCNDWILCDMATAMLGCILVGIDADTETKNIEHILATTDSCILITEPGFFSKLENITFPTSMKLIIAHPGSKLRIDKMSEAEHAEFLNTLPLAAAKWKVAQSGGPNGQAIPIQSFADTFRAGQAAMDANDTKDDFGLPVLRQKRAPHDIFTLQFTSGSTGSPKGSITTQDVWCEDTFGGITPFDPQVVLAWRPFPYSAGRELMWRTISRGGRLVVFQGEIGDIFEEAQKVNPSNFSAPPRVWQILYDRYRTELRTALQFSGLERFLRRGTGHLKTKEEMDPADAADNSVESARYRAHKVRNTVLTKYSRCLGNRLQSVSFGGSATKPELRQFLQDLFPSEALFENYGTTEAGGLTADGRIGRSVQIKLIDVPPDFLTTNKPHPQGEICVRTRFLSTGYWRDEENTRKMFYIDEDGVKWNRTGDIGEIQNGVYLKILDRNRNVVKLANSTFVALQTIEVTLQGSIDEVEDLFAYAESGWEFPVAVVSLKPGVTQSLTPSERLDLEGRILQQIQSVGGERGLPASHLPHGVVVTEEHFTVENRLLTNSMKLAREELKKRFHAQMTALYTSLTEMTPQNSTDAMGERTNSEFFDTGSSRVAEGVLALYKRVLRLQQVNSGSTAPQLGADSISGAMLRTKLRSRFGVDVSYQTLWTSTVAEIIGEVEQRLQADEAKLGEPVKVSDVDRIRTLLKRYSDLSPMKLKTTSEARVEDLRTRDKKKTILLTGATGFIGAEILRCLLSLATGGPMDAAVGVNKVICLVRGSVPGPSGNSTALAKVQEAVGSQLNVATMVEGGHLEVLASDLEATGNEEGESIFGLEPDLLARLVEEVDGVIHCGANVNHVLPFTELAAANVGATQQLLRLFCMNRVGDAHPLDFAFISTGSVSRLTEGFGSCARSRKELEDDVLVDPNVSGYALSKWAAERLVERAAGTLAGNSAIRLAIVRCGMTSWHTALGHGNRRDWLYALCNGVAKLGLFPEAEWQQRTKDPLHLNVAPVDWVADCISRLMLAPHPQETPATQNAAPTAPLSVPIISLSNHQHLLSLRSLFETKFKARGVPVQEWTRAVEQRLGEGDPTDVSDETQTKGQSTAAPVALRRLHATLFMFQHGAPHNGHPCTERTSDVMEHLSENQGRALLTVLLKTPSLWEADPRLNPNEFTDSFASWLSTEQ